MSAPRSILVPRGTRTEDHPSRRTAIRVGIRSPTKDQVSRWTGTGLTSMGTGGSAAPFTGTPMTDRASSSVASEAARRRTFAIISHPDAGKTTLTETLLLYAGALEEAGAVKARAGKQRDVTSDWMELERQRGISITSTVLQFEYRDHVLNLLDTPGHRDFSEDTYRVLSAVDAAVIVLDAAKGIEPQTLKLFEVARSRGIPLLTFVNKVDRPSLSGLELMDDIETQLGLVPTPVTWPVGAGNDFQGVVDRRDGKVWRSVRSTPGAKQAEEAARADRSAD